MIGRSLRVLAVAAAVALGAPAPNAAAPPAGLPLDRIRLPPGFQIALYAGGASGARSMALGTEGTLFVGTIGAENVYAIVDRNRDGVGDDGLVIASRLVAPNGVAFRDGALFVADGFRILRFDDIESRLERPPRPVVVYDGLPRDAWHGWKYLRFGPDGFLYFGIGAPCNVCEREDSRYATISRLKPDGRGFEVFAHGVRNSMGFDWDPRTKDLWFSDNGRDALGDDSPPDEIDHAPRPGMHFGYPYVHGRSVVDPQFDKSRGRQPHTPPAVEVPAHAVPLGMRFYEGAMFPPEYRGRLFVAEHGSGERSVPIGARITVVEPAAAPSARYRVFAEGWQQETGRWGRPVDVLVMPDGALLVSDDQAGAIYRITYKR